MALDFDKIRAEVGSLTEESLRFFDNKPRFTVTISRKATKIFGRLIDKITPDELAAYVEQQAFKFVWPNQPVVFHDAYHDPVRFDLVLDGANRTHRNSMILIFGEGVVGSVTISGASILGPIAGVGMSLADLSAYYLLLMRRSFEIQKAFCLTPTLELSVQAFCIATAATYEERMAAFHEGGSHMLQDMLAHHLDEHAREEFKDHLRDSAMMQMASNFAARFTPAEALDSAAEQSTRLALQSFIRIFIQKHPQVMAAALPVVGALVSGAWSTWGTRDILRANFHLSRLKYLSLVRRQLSPALLAA